MHTAKTLTLATCLMAASTMPAWSYYDLSDQPETGMYPKQEGVKPGGGKRPGKRPPPPPSGSLKTVKIGPATFKVDYTLFEDFDHLPNDIQIERMPIQSFTRPEGGTHYYEAVLVSSENVSWVQAAILAKSAGGYLASITSKAENDFVFNLVNDEKFFWEFPDAYTPDSHYRIKIGPFLGGTRISDSNKSDEGWTWISGEKWTYSNWAQNIDDGVVDRDPRNNTQPNGRGRQNIMGFGELNKPVSTWGDYFDKVAQYDNRRLPAGFSRGFIIEYDTKPVR